jgi:TRAP transporter TAXI family solute receptor
MDIDKDMIAEHLDYSEANIGLKDKTLDAIFVWADVPIPGIMEIATVCCVRIIPLAEEILEEPVKESSYCSVTSIPKETYRGMTEDVRTIAVPALLICDSKLSEELVSKMTKSLYENIDVVRAMHIRAKNIQIKSTLDGVGIPLHPGAERYS